MLVELLGFLVLLGLFHWKLRSGYEVPKLYILAAYLLQFLAYWGFDEYLDPSLLVFPHGFVPLVAVLELVAFGLIVFRFLIDMELNPWRYRLDREQYRDSLFQHATIYWHITHNSGLVYKAFLFLAIVLMSSIESLLLSATAHGVNPSRECSVILALSVITTLAGFSEFILLPMNLEAGYSNRYGEGRPTNH